MPRTTKDKVINELFDRLVQDIPDHYPGQEPGRFPLFSSPREACKQILVNVNHRDRGVAAKSLLAPAQDINNLGAGSIFLLICRAFPMCIANVVGGIQPMLKPKGKLFFLDAYEAGEVYVRLRLASMEIQARREKLNATWSAEDIQALGLYPDIDTKKELVGGIARDIALERNKDVLDAMLNAAPQFATVNGKDAVSCIQRLDKALFNKVHGALTHIIVGVDAALALAKSRDIVFTVGATDMDVDTLAAYPGVMSYGTVTLPNGLQFRVFKSNFWQHGTPSGSKILGFHKGSEWSDVPYIWTPYTERLGNNLQGIVSTGAGTVVSPKSMGSITIEGT